MSGTIHGCIIVVVSLSLEEERILRSVETGSLTTLMRHRQAGTIKLLMLIKYLHWCARRACMSLIDSFYLVTLWEYYGGRVAILCRQRLVCESSGCELRRIWPYFLVTSITIACQLLGACLVKISRSEGRYISILIRIDW